MNENFTYTAYAWVNWMYMSEKQWGIQTAHCISEMSTAHFGRDVYNKWANAHKTIVMFNGSNSITIKRIFTILQYAARNFKKVGIELPHAIFREDIEALDGAVTACSIILPNEVRQFKLGAPEVCNPPLWAMPFLTDTRVLDDAQEPIVYTTGTMHDIAEQANSRHTANAQRSAFMGYEYTPYEYDRFNLVEFNDWLDRQRLA